MKMLFKNKMVETIAVRSGLDSVPTIKPFCEVVAKINEIVDYINSNSKEYNEGPSYLGVHSRYMKNFLECIHISVCKKYHRSFSTLLDDTDTCNPPFKCLYRTRKNEGGEDESKTSVKEEETCEVADSENYMQEDYR